MPTIESEASQIMDKSFTILSECLRDSLHFADRILIQATNEISSIFEDGPYIPYINQTLEFDEPMYRASTQLCLYTYISKKLSMTNTEYVEKNTLVQDKLSSYGWAEDARHNGYVKKIKPYENAKFTATKRIPIFMSYIENRRFVYLGNKQEVNAFLDLLLNEEVVLPQFLGLSSTLVSQLLKVTESETTVFKTLPFFTMESKEKLSLILYANLSSFIIMFCILYNYDKTGKFYYDKNEDISKAAFAEFRQLGHKSLGDKLWSLFKNEVNRRPKIG